MHDRVDVCANRISHKRANNTCLTANLKISFIKKDLNYKKILNYKIIKKLFQFFKYLNAKTNKKSLKINIKIETLYN